MEFSAQAIQAAVDAAYASGARKAGGANANYIPYLASAPSELFGVAVMTADGRLFTAGDADYAFAIESISKVFTLALVTEIIGSEAVRQKVGVSPTGLPVQLGDGPRIAQREAVVSSGKRRRHRHGEFGSW
jgi:glutaminase